MRLKNKTKIIATIGPATSSKETLTEIIKSGVNVCRLNFSHGSHADHKQVIRNIQEINNELGVHTAILADLQGPKLRIGEVEGGEAFLEDGSELTITNEECLSTAERLYINYEQFPSDVAKGEKVLINDGKLVLEVLSTDEKSKVQAKVLHGGELTSNKGVNLPNTKVSLPCLTEKDRKDLELVLEEEPSWVALSFVRSEKDIIELKKIIEEREKRIKIVAKIEKPEALERIDEIIRETDAVMVARGDLGVEVPMQNVPLHQKAIIEKCQRAARPVIIATQMMESMIENITPTRAEVNDVATAVMDGADAVMLSGETSVGKYPVEVIKAMYKIIMESETFEGIYYKEHFPEPSEHRFISDAICFNSCELAQRVKAEAIVTMTFSGYTAFKISSFRPKAWTFAFTSNHKILNMLSLVWGVKGFYYDKFVSTDHTISDIKYFLRKEGYLEEDDLLINIASMPIAEKGMSNMMKLSYAK